MSNLSITVLDGKQWLIDQNGTIVLEPDYDASGFFKAIEKWKIIIVRLAQYSFELKNL